MHISSRYVAGSVMAWMACLSRKQIIAVSLETAMQNVGIAVLVLQVVIDNQRWILDVLKASTFYILHPQSNLESPYGDMALLSVIGYLLSR